MMHSVTGKEKWMTVTRLEETAHSRPVRFFDYREPDGEADLANVVNGDV
jgi:hypothetical protein